MSKPRSNVLMGCDTFYDADVQRVLCAVRDAAIKQDSPIEVLLKGRIAQWPLLAFNVAEALSKNDSIYTAECSMVFQTLYSLSPRFMAELLYYVSKYDSLPESDWTLIRKLEHYGTFDFTVLNTTKEPELVDFDSLAATTNHNGKGLSVNNIYNSDYLRG